MTNTFTGKLVYAFARNEHEEVWAYVQPFKGQELAHIRIVTSDKDGVGRPTKRGVAVRVEDLPALEEAVAALRAATEGLKGA